MFSRRFLGFFRAVTRRSETSQGVLGDFRRLLSVFTGFKEGFRGVPRRFRGLRGFLRSFRSYNGLKWISEVSVCFQEGSMDVLESFKAF